MPSYEPVVKNGASGAIFYVALPSMATSGTMQVNPTLAAGDVKISKDGGALANLATLPTVTPAAGALVKVTLSQAETNADSVAVIFVDQTAPKEWTDTLLSFNTVAQNFDSLATLIATLQADTDDIQTRLPAALVSGRMSSQVGAIGADVITAAALATDAVTEIADGLLDRDMALGTDSGSSSVRTVRQALRALRNKWTIAAGSYQVTKENDSTVSWQAVVTGTPGADPITGSDPT